MQLTILCRNIPRQSFSIKPLKKVLSNVQIGFSMIRRGLSTEQQSKENSASPNEIDNLKKEILDKNNQLKELKDSYLMALADMENLRTRTKREVESAGNFAIQKFCKDIISVADILEMALKSMNPSARPMESEQPEEDATCTPIATDPAKQLQDLTNGLSMTLGELHKAFGKHGLTVIDPLYQKFDPNSHNALFEIPAMDVDPGTIVSVQKKGYMLHQRVIRPADVGVSRRS